MCKEKLTVEEGYIPIHWADNLDRLRGTGRFKEADMKESDCLIVQRLTRLYCARDVIEGCLFDIPEDGDRYIVIYKEICDLIKIDKERLDKRITETIRACTIDIAQPKGKSTNDGG